MLGQNHAGSVVREQFSSWVVYKVREHNNQNSFHVANLLSNHSMSVSDVERTKMVTVKGTKMVGMAHFFGPREVIVPVTEGINWRGTFSGAFCAW